MTSPPAPSWNYRHEAGRHHDRHVLHWQYVITPVRNSNPGPSAIPIFRAMDNRASHQGNRRRLGLRDLPNWKDGTLLQFNSSWCVRVRRDDLLTIQVDGDKACPAPPACARVVAKASAKRPSRSEPDIPSDQLLRRWQKSRDDVLRQRIQDSVELFLRHVAWMSRSAGACRRRQGRATGRVVCKVGRAAVG